jgi:hypothetical protein
LNVVGHTRVQASLRLAQLARQTSDAASANTSFPVRLIVEAAAQAPAIKTKTNAPINIVFGIFRAP